MLSSHVEIILRKRVSLRVEIDELIIDHAWGLANLGPLDLQFGKVPIGWGTGYVFNPTARTASASFFDTVNEETPGTIGVVPSLYFGDKTLTGYLAFQDRSGKTIAAQGDGDGENLPFGLKVQTMAASFHLSLGFIKEVLYVDQSGFRRNYYLSFDMDGGIGDLGLYAEAALKTPWERDRFSWEDFDFEESLALAAGCYYTLPLVAADLRLEYFHQGCGRSEASSYDVAALLSSEQVMLAEDYLFLHLEKELIDYLKSGLGGLVNLNDGSFVIYPELSYEVFNNLQFSLGAFMFFGGTGSEFYGEFSMDGNDIDLIETFSLYGLCKISF